jgi:hypothetical protein
MRSGRGFINKNNNSRICNGVQIGSYPFLTSPKKGGIMGQKKQPTPTIDRELKKAEKKKEKRERKEFKKTIREADKNSKRKRGQGG